jgi:hypothetical protein
MAKGRVPRSEETPAGFMKNVLAAFEERQRRADAETRAFTPTPIEVSWLELADAIGKTVSARDVPLHIAVALDAEETRWRWSQLGDGFASIPRDAM